MDNETISRAGLLDTYAKGPAQLDQILNGLTADQLDQSLSSDTWTIRQIAHHIVDGDDIWNTCIKIALGNPEGEFHLQWYWDQTQVEWAKKWQYKTRSLVISLALFQANRDHIVELLRLMPECWERSARIHWPGETEEGRITIQDVVKMHNNHLAGHLEDIQAILNVSPKK
jgi:hypothetical protein